MFLLIYGPKTSGWLDVVSITSVVLVAVHFSILNTTHIPVAARNRMLTLLAAFGLLLGYATGHHLCQLDPNSYQVLRFGRVIVNFLGVAALVSLYYRWLGDAASSLILRHLLHCLVIHAAIMLCMFQSDGFRDLIVNHVVQADPDSRTYLAKATGYRIAGLTDSWDALSGLQSLGLLMLPVLLTRQVRFSYVYAILATPLLLFSVAISGRTGFVTSAILMPVAVAFTNLRKLHRTTLVAVAVSMLVTGLLLGPLRNACLEALEDSSLGRTIAMFGLDYRTADHGGEHFSDTLAGILQEHYFLPETWGTLLLGTGGSGRESWDYVPADNGLVLNLHSLGLGGFLVIYGTMAWLTWSGLRVRRYDLQVAGVCVLALGLILLIDIKVMYVFSRNGFTVMLLPVLVSWWESARARPTGRRGRPVISPSRNFARIQGWNAKAHASLHHE